MKQEGQYNVRKGVAKIKIKLDEAMSSDRYHISMSIIEPKREDLAAPVVMEVLEGKTDKEFTVQFKEKTVEKLTLVYIVEE